MARKIQSDVYGSSRPKITQDDIEDGDVGIFTIAEFDDQEVDDPETESGKRMAAFLTFEETGDKRLWLNKTQIDTLIERLGDDADKWAGQRIPLEKVTTTFKGQKYAKVAVCPAAEWDDYLKPARNRKRGK